MAEKLLQYDVIERLGEGAKSVIFRVEDPATRKQYAMKHVVRADAKDIRFIEQMENEFEVSKNFTHPNLRKSFELKINKTLLMKVTEAFLLMELVDGKPLEERPPTGLLDVIDTFLKASAGLKAMHAMGYVHCDIKPNNILRNEKGDVKIIDFGQSARIGTVKERIQGTPDYIAPEQVNRKPVEVQTDIYNLGATLYWALVGKPIPTLYTVNKKGENSFLVDYRIETPQQLNPNVPLPLSNLTIEMISTRIDKRPANLDEVITRLELAKHVYLKQLNPGNPPATSVEGSSAVSDLDVD